MSRRKPKWTQEPLSSQLRYEYEYQLRKLYLQHDKVSAALRYAPESLSLLSKRQSLQRQIYDVELQARSDMVSLASGLDPSSITPSKSLTSKDGVETYARLVAKQAAKSTASTSKEDAKPVPKVWSWKGRKVQIVPKGSDKSERERIHRGGFGGRGPIYRDLDSRLLDYSTLVLEKDSSEKRGDVPVSESGPTSSEAVQPSQTEKSTAPSPPVQAPSGPFALGESVEIVVPIRAKEVGASRQVCYFPARIVNSDDASGMYDVMRDDGILVTSISKDFLVAKGTNAPPFVAKPVNPVAKEVGHVIPAAVEAKGEEKEGDRRETITESTQTKMESEIQGGKRMKVESNTEVKASEEFFPMSPKNTTTRDTEDNTDEPLDPKFVEVASKVSAHFCNDEHAKIKYDDFRPLLHLLGHSVSGAQVEQIREELCKSGLSAFTVSQKTFCKWYLREETQQFLSKSAPGVVAGAALWTVLRLQMVEGWFQELWKGTAKGAEPFAINEESCSCTSQTTFSAVQAEALDATEATQKPIKITVEMIGSSAAANRSKSGDAANAAAAIKPKASAPIYSTGPEGANFALALNLDLREDAKGRAIALQTVIELVCDMFVRDFLVSDLLSTGSTKEWYESNADKIVVVEATDAAKIRVIIYGKEENSTVLGRLMQRNASVSPENILQGSSFSLALEFATSPVSFLDPMSWFASSATTTSTLVATAGVLEFVKQVFDVKVSASPPMSFMQVDSAESLVAWASVTGRRFASALLSCKHMNSKSTSSSLLEKVKWASSKPGLHFLLENRGKVSEVWSRTLYAAFFQSKEPLLEKLYMLVRTSVDAVSSVEVSSELTTASIKLDNVSIANFVPFSAEELKAVGAKETLDDKECALVATGLLALPGIIYEASFQ